MSEAPMEARSPELVADEVCPEPPGRLNVGLALGILAIQLAALAVAGWSTSVAGVALATLVFALFILPLYSLLHEAEHRVFHRDSAINDGFGVVLAAFFPGSFTFLRACHLGHHRRNRSAAEVFDYVCPGDRLWQKRLGFYTLYLGAFWLAVPLATVALLVYPRAVQSSLVQDAPSAAAMVNGIAPRFLRRIRLECLAVVALHTGIAWVVGPGIWALLYGVAGLSWSSQQYITHAGSPLDVIHGAHNLKAHPLYAGLLLNFNWHLAHHQHPRVPWLYLPRFDDPTRVRPGYLISFIRFWRGPVPLPPGVEGPAAARR